MDRNISLMYVIGGLVWARFFIPVMALFYIASKVPLEQFAIIMSVFALSTLLFEIPAGVVADLLGKKKTLILSRICYVIEIYILAFHNGFWLFLIAKVVSGIGVSLASGTTEALMFDTLKKINREEKYKKFYGTLQAITQISMGLVFVIGAWLFTISPKLPAYFSLPFVLLALILTFQLEEPYKSYKVLNLENMVAHFKEGINLFWRNSKTRAFAFYSLPIATAISIVLSISSAYFDEISIPIALIGVINLLAWLLGAFISKRAHAIDEQLQEKKSLQLIRWLLIGNLVGLAFMFPYFGLIFFFLLAAVNSYYSVIITDYMNKYSSSVHRTTVLSIRSFFDNLGIFFVFPVIGFLSKIWSLKIALWGLLAITLILMYVGFKLANRKQKEFVAI